MKNITIFSLLLLFFISCSEDDLNSVDAGFINNINFVTETIVSDITFSSEDVPRVLSTPSGQYLLGVYNDPNFGTLSAGFVSQLAMPTEINTYRGVIYPDSIVIPKIDDVVLYVPYQATATSIDENNLNIYKLDSIFGVKDYSVSPTVYGSFGIEVHELETFLNPFNPSDPSKINTYYTDKVYEVTGNGSQANGSLAALTYTPTAIDTVTKISRTVNGISYDESISMSANAPRMAIRLDKDFFQTHFLDKLPKFGEDVPAEFASQDAFNRYFKGLYVTPTSTDPGSILSLLLRNSYVEIYYTNLIKKISTGELVDEIPESIRFSFGGVKAGQYVPSRVAKNPEKMYVQGAAGSITNIKILGFNGDSEVVSSELAELRKNSNNDEGVPIWLINEANLQLYLDDSDLSTSLDTIYKLFLYKKVQDKDGNPLYDSQMLDYLSASNISSIEGDLLKDEIGYYYKFRLTDYITDLLDGRSTYNIDNLGLKVYKNGDYPSTTNDTVVGNESWEPRGVVLYGGDSDARKPVLKINYSYQKISEN